MRSTVEGIRREKFSLELSRSVGDGTQSQAINLYVLPSRYRCGGSRSLALNVDYGALSIAGCVDGKHSRGDGA